MTKRRVTKATRQRDASVFGTWTEMENGSPNRLLYHLALELIPQDDLDGYWAGRPMGFDAHRPVRPVIDSAERDVLSVIHPVLCGLE